MTHVLIIRPDRVELTGIVRFSCFDLVPGIYHSISFRSISFVVVADNSAEVTGLPFLRKSVLTNLSTYGNIGIRALGLADIAIDCGCQDTKGDTTSSRSRWPVLSLRCSDQSHLDTPSTR